MGKTARRVKADSHYVAAGAVLPLASGILPVFFRGSAGGCRCQMPQGDWERKVRTPQGSVPCASAEAGSESDRSWTVSQKTNHLAQAGNG